MYQAEIEKSVAERRGKHQLAIVLSGAAFVVLSWWSKLSPDHAAFKLSVLFGVAFVCYLVLYFFIHVVRLYGTGAINWASAPVTYLVPIFVVILWSMFS